MKICLKKILLAGAAAVLLASPSFAWTIRINGNGMNYEGAQRGNELVYRSKGKSIGVSRVLGGEIEYRDGKGKIVGFAKKTGNEWVFRDDRGKIIGTAVKLGKELIYKNANSSILGTAVVFGSTTEYRSSNNAPIGKADTVRSRWNVLFTAVLLLNRLRNLRRSLLQVIRQEMLLIITRIISL